MAGRSRSAATVAWASALMAACVLGGCPKRTEAPPRLVEVKVSLRDQAGAVPVGSALDDLTARVKLRFDGTRLLGAATGEPARSGVDYRLVIEGRLQDGVVGSEGVLQARLSSRLMRVEAPPTEVPVRTEVVAERAHEVARPATATEVRAHLERALDDAVDGMVRLARARLGATSDRIQALRSDDEEVRREAARGLGERREREAVAVLVPMLKDPRPEVRDLALGTLIEIGDPSAARPIAEMARLGDAAQVPRIIDAMAILGGAEARAYLEFVVSSHDDEEIRALARAALQRLDRREGAGVAPRAAPGQQAGPQAGSPAAEAP